MVSPTMQRLPNTPERLVMDEPHIDFCMSQSDPQRCRVSVSIDFHQVLNALDEFVDKYPVERVSRDVVNRLHLAADRLSFRLRP